MAFTTIGFPRKVGAKDPIVVVTSDRRVMGGWSSIAEAMRWAHDWMEISQDRWAWVTTVEQHHGGSIEEKQNGKKKEGSKKSEHGTEGA